MSYTLLTVFFLAASGNDINPIEIQELILAGLEYAYVEKFDSSQIYFDTIIELYPDNPAGYFFKAALLQVKMMDECHYNNEKEYLELMKQTITNAEKILKQEQNLWAKFYLASSYTYRAVYEGFKNNYFETFTLGVKGGRMLQDIVREDTTFYDAYLGAGSFEYFWARAARYLPLLKLIGGDVEEALRKLNVAAEKSLYSGPTTQNSLVFICGEEGQYDRATAIADNLLHQYPESKTFLWSKANLEYKKKTYSLAVNLYTDLFKRYDELNKKNYSNLAQCKLLIGKCYYELKEKEKAKEALKDVIYYKKYSDQYPHIEGYSREAYGLLSRLL
jgi:tetratricopeptide (TPR) repeat protein